MKCVSYFRLHVQSWSHVLILSSLALCLKLSENKTNCWWTCVGALPCQELQFELKMRVRLQVGKDKCVAIRKTCCLCDHWEQTKRWQLLLTTGQPAISRSTSYSPPPPNPTELPPHPSPPLCITRTFQNMGMLHHNHNLQSFVYCAISFCWVDTVDFVTGLRSLH